MTTTDAGVRQLRPGAPEPAMPGTLAEALARFQADLPRIVKGNTAKVTGKDGKEGYKYAYADLADVSDAVLKRIGTLGLFFTAWPVHREEDGKFGLEYTLGHVSGEKREGWWELRDNLTMQQMGGMITYARRYILLAVTGAHPDGEDDDAASSQQVPSRRLAGDAFEDASPVRPQQGDGPYRRMLAEADTVTSDAAADRLTRAASSAKDRRLITRDQCDHVQNRVRARLSALRETARPVDVEDLGRQAAEQHPADREEAPAPAEEAGQPGDKRHKALVGAVQGEFKRLGFTDDDRADRLWAAGKLARVRDLESLNALDHGELRGVARELARCRDRAKLEEVLAKFDADSTGETSG